MPGAHGCTGCLAASRLWATASRGHRAAGVKGEPSCHTPGQLTGSRDGQGLALSPGSRGYDHLFHSCPPPPSLGAGESPGQRCQSRRGGGTVGTVPEGKSGSSSMRSREQSKKPPGQKEHQAGWCAGWREVLLRSHCRKGRCTQTLEYGVSSDMWSGPSKKLRTPHILP